MLAMLAIEYLARQLISIRLAEAGVTREHLAKVLNHIEGGAAATRV